MSETLGQRVTGLRRAIRDAGLPWAQPARIEGACKARGLGIFCACVDVVVCLMRVRACQCGVPVCGVRVVHVGEHLHGGNGVMRRPVCRTWYGLDAVCTFGSVCALLVCLVICVLCDLCALCAFCVLRVQFSRALCALHYTAQAARGCTRMHEDARGCTRVHEGA